MVSISEKEIQKARTPSDLRQYCDDLRANAENDQSERHKSHRRKGDGKLYQPYFTEIVPLALFSSVYYRDVVNIQPVLGNQQYDAEVQKWDVTFEKIEITKPHDGKELSDDLNLMADRGYGKSGLDTPLQSLQKLRPFIMKTAEKKAANDYASAVLVFVLTYDPPYPPLKEEESIEKLLKEYKQILQSYKYKARKVLMFDVISNNFYTVQRGSIIHEILRLFIGKK